MIFSLVIFLFLVPFLSGGPAHGHQNVEDTLQDIASVMRSSLKEENCVCKSPLVSSLSALSRLTFKDFELALLQLQSWIAAVLTPTFFTCRVLLEMCALKGVKSLFVKKMDGMRVPQG